MSDWVKILISAVCGMFAGIVGGLLLEPLKQTISQRLNVRLLRKRIYYDLGRIGRFALSTGKEKIPKASVVRITDTAAFDFYYETKRELFYLLPEYQGLTNLCGIIKDVRRELVNDVISTTEALERIERNIQQSYVGDEIDASVMRKAIDYYEKRLDHLVRIRKIQQEREEREAKKEAAAR